jgi:threonine/homoserine/homoserine lactone efflux protein
MSPWPNAFMVLQNAAQSRKLGLMTSAGIVPATLIFAITGLAGIGAIMATQPWIKLAMSLCCGLFLFYLGIRQIIASFSQKQAITEKTTQISYRQAFLSGFITNITNPKTIAYFMGIFAATKAFELPFVYQVIIVLTWYSVLALLASSKTAGAFITKSGAWFNRISGVVMIGFGVELLLER